MSTPEDRIKTAIEVLEHYGGTDESHHQTWVIDQVARALLGADYPAWVIDMKDGEDGPDTYDWNEGIPP